MSPAAPPPTREGDIVDGKYRVVRVLGAGGMGVVVAAEHIALRQRVAIKFLLPEAMSGEDTLARFLREAQAAARMQSEHVARVLDVATLNDTTPYMVMEFLDGQDLGQLLAARGSLPLEEAVGYIVQACEGLAEAHAAGIIHRDIKPSNLFICERGVGRPVVKVLDFGISKTPNSAAGALELSLTKTSAVMGSPLYMSPEQMTSAKNVDVRTDIWSLGVTLYEILCGRTPYTGESMTELVAAVLQNEPLSIVELRPDLPPAFVTALGRSMQKARDRRFSNMGEFATAIAPFGPRHSALNVERILEVIGGAPTMAARPVGSDPPGHITGPANVGALALGVTAPAVSASPPGALQTGRTTSQPVSTDPAPGGSTGKGRTSLPRMAIVGATVVAVLGIGGTVATRWGGPKSQVALNPDPPASTSPLPTNAAPPPAAASSAPSPKAPDVVEGAPASSTPPVASSVTHRAVSPRPALSAAPTAAAVVKSSAPATPAPAPTCRTVQYFDADGEIRFKRECP